MQTTYIKKFNSLKAVFFWLKNNSQDVAEEIMNMACECFLAYGKSDHEKGKTLIK